MEHLIKSQQFSLDDLESLFTCADTIQKCPALYANSLSRKVMATLFYEPSTRTRLSFEAAMHRMGGKVISTENAAEFSSASKGESLADTVRIVSSYADVIVLRHPVEGSAAIAASVSSVPVINAGDGRGQHPTQALTDLYTMHREFGRVNGLRIALVGDLANGRTVRSLAYLCSKFHAVDLNFVSPPNLCIGQDIKNHLQEHRVYFHETSDFASIAPLMDVIYMTRIQKERMSSGEYEKSRGQYVIDNSNLHLINPNSRIMHPLPHVEEIALSIDVEKNDKRVAYFRQAQNGMYARMALLKKMVKSSN